jgi:hypothetical protein
VEVHELELGSSEILGKSGVRLAVRTAFPSSSSEASMIEPDLLGGGC